MSNISQAKRDLLEKFLRGELKQPTSPRSINQRDPRSPLQLSFAQERLWFLDQLNPNSAVFNVPLTVKLTSAIDIEVLRRSINEIVRRHEPLRTTFRSVEGQPQVVIATELNIYVPFVDLISYPEPERELRAHTLLSEEERRPFDLTRGPLIRAGLFRLSDQDHRFLVNMHHIVSDGWSLVLFFNELSTIYDAFARGAHSPLTDVTVRYFDYSAWQREWLQGEVLQKQVAYWKNQLGGDLPILELPTDRPRPAVQTFNGDREWLVLSEQLTASVLALAQRECVTQFITLLTAFKVLLHRYAGQDDVIVGSPIANRPQTETEPLIGFFLNNLALRSDLSGNPSFRETLARVKKTALDAYAHQDVPFEKLIEAIKPERDLSRTPIFQVYFNLFNFADEIKLPGSDNTVSFVEAWEESDEKLSKFDLTLYAGLQDQRLKLALVYNTDLFDAQSIALMLAHFRSLLAAAVADPEKSIADLSLEPGPQSRLQVSPPRYVRPTNAFTKFSKAEIEHSIAGRFACQVAKYPTRIAVKSKDYEWTYQDLDAAVHNVAQSILRLSGDSEERIALLFEHDAPMVSGMLGALKAGKTYVPLDPHHPKERLLQIIEHSQAAAVLTNNRNRALADELARMTQGRVKLINVDRLRSVTTNVPALEVPSVEAGQLAYILYTSGSTGEPKGVMQSHRNVLHYIRVYTNNLHLNADDRLTLLSSYCFDASVMDIYGALLNGATLYPIDIREDGLAGLSERLVSDEITVYHSTPTVYRYFLSALGAQASLPAEGAQSSLPAHVGNRDLPFPKIRLIVLGGEKVNRTDVELYQQHFSDDCLFINGLGPTEATVSLQNFIDKKTKASGESVPVGFAVEDTEVLLLDKSGRVSAVSGEIAIRSAHVALGYWRNSEATATAFSTNGHGPSIRLYRTGDMGRRLPDGSIKFEGRKDFQIKIRGFRVELGEIESVLAQHRLVRECVVIAHENGGGDKKLIAYVVSREKQTPAGTSTTHSISAELRNFLKQKLPEYMVPASFVILESLPLTASGKLNRRALGAQASGVPIGAAPMGCSSLPADAQDSQYRQSNQSGLPVSAAPQTPLEKMLTTLWSELLEVKVISVNDNFFELGGHSLLAVRLFAQIEKRLGKRLPLATLFQAPTVAQLATIMEKGLQKDPTVAWSSLVEIQAGRVGSVAGSKPATSKPPFFCVHALGGNVLEYYDLARHLGEDQPFYGLQSQGLDDQRPPHTRVEDMAAHYIKEMRERQPEGPYFIGGRSLGGMVAFEMARQLKAQGQAIGLLALLDTYPSGYAKLFRNEKTLRAALRRGLKRTKAHLVNLQGLSVDEGISYLVKKARFAPRKMKSQVWRRIYQSYENFGRPLPRMLNDIKEINSLAVREYVPQVYDGKVTLFWASEDLRTSIDLVEGWRVLAGCGIEVHEIPGSHLDIVKEPHVGELATKLSSCFDRDKTHK